MVSPGEGLPTSNVIVELFGATLTGGVVSVLGCVVVAAGAGVVAVAPADPGAQKSVALAVGDTPAWLGSSPRAMGTSMTLSAPVTDECA
jgi:hypothetical protein